MLLFPNVLMIYWACQSGYVSASFWNFLLYVRENPTQIDSQKKESYWLKNIKGLGWNFAVTISEFRIQTLSSLFSFSLCIEFASFTGSMQLQGDDSSSLSSTLFGSSTREQMPNDVSVLSAKVSLVLIVLIGSHDNPVNQSLWPENMMCRLVLVTWSAPELSKSFNLGTVDWKWERNGAQRENRGYF